MRIHLLSLLALSLISSAPACNDDGDNNAGTDSDSDSGGGEGCDGPITDCPLAELSEEQQATYCDTLLAAIDDEPGTQYTCEADGTYLTVNTAAECRANEVSADCPITVGDLIDCYKAAKDDACAAFAEDGTCGPVFSQGASCV
ncbi:hypothetical protein SAMN02745121_05764 [Nannocystis exedens]|uniref:Uncharacterized protein n=1 Tax=Nannocystis exedens TaxID=54 RepID=A0A1I2DWG6_9BACT|nr:hypothetical protein [Nannocystis exedens]PCC69116.1 hypothetical protein NAEX_02138 [Nannocystis exedens]SFE84974.1 hypothetical protein SAMN02745121_05764 [Nannocystis exedens]